jgi:hypothetical protein
MTYSASAIDANYCLGMLTASADADLLDPKSWVKSTEPVFRSSEAAGIWGPGHNSFTTTPDGKTDLMVFHAREYREILGSELADPNRHTRVQVLRWKADGSPDFGSPQPDAGHIAAKPLYRDPVFDGAADPVVIYSGSYGRWYMFYTNRRAKAEGVTGVEWVHGTRIGMAESLDSGATWRHAGEADIDLPPELGGAQVTMWAPEVVRDGMGIHHMFLTVVPGIFPDWNHPRRIVHLTSKDLRSWHDARVVPLATERNETDNKAIWYADSPDLESWSDRGRLITDQAGEAPKAFAWRGKHWLINDVWKGLAVYGSDDGERWIRQDGNLLASPGRGADDQAAGQHADVVVVADRAWLFYFTHPGRKPNAKHPDNYQTRRSSIQVVELHETDGRLTVDRDAPTRIALRAP